MDSAAGLGGRDSLHPVNTTLKLELAVNSFSLDGRYDLFDSPDAGLDETELRIDTYRASGPGGQHVNKTDSAVRITHIPTGIVAQCQDERSQHKNRAKAMRMLRTKLFEMEEEKRRGELSETKKTLVGSGDRSEKIRTYNFPQGRVTDHRIGLTLHKLEAILEGELDELAEALGAYQQQKKLKEFTDG